MEPTQAVIGRLEFERDILKKVFLEKSILEEVAKRETIAAVEALAAAEERLEAKKAEREVHHNQT